MLVVVRTIVGSPSKGLEGSLHIILDGYTKRNIIDTEPLILNPKYFYS